MVGFAFDRNCNPYLLDNFDFPARGSDSLRLESGGCEKSNGSPTAILVQQRSRVAARRNRSNGCPANNVAARFFL